MTWSAVVEVIDGDTVVDELPVDSGQVTEDAQAPHRQVGQVTFLSGEVNPATVTDLFANDSTHLLRPVVEGTELGVFRPRPGTIPFGPEVSWPLGLIDLSGEIARNSWTSTFTIAGVSAEQAIKAIVEDRLSISLSYNLEPLSYTVDRTLGQQIGGNPWADVQAIAESAGAEAFIDGLTLVVRTIPDPDTTADSFTHHVGTMIGGARTVDTLDSFNQVVVTGVTAAGVSVTAKYPTSVARPRPHPVRNDYIESQPQADDVAEKTYRKVGGLREMVDFTALDPDLTLRAGQVGVITERASGTAGRWVLDRIVRPIDVRTDQTGQTRQRVTG